MQVYIIKIKDNIYLKSVKISNLRKTNAAMKEIRGTEDIKDALTFCGFATATQVAHLVDGEVVILN